MTLLAVFHGYEGPLVVEQRGLTPLGDVFVNAGAELGYEALDHIDQKPEGA